MVRFVCGRNKTAHFNSVEMALSLFSCKYYKITPISKSQAYLCRVVIWSSILATNFGQLTTVNKKQYGIIKFSNVINSFHFRREFNKLKLDPLWISTLPKIIQTQKTLNIAKCFAEWKSKNNKLYSSIFLWVQAKDFIQKAEYMQCCSRTSYYVTRD